MHSPVSAENLKLLDLVRERPPPCKLVEFDISLGHIEARSGGQMMAPDPRIVNRISQFKFDTPAYFPPDAYDQVWLFGISTNYAGRA